MRVELIAMLALLASGCRPPMGSDAWCTRISRQIRDADIRARSRVGGSVSCMNTSYGYVTGSRSWASGSATGSEWCSVSDHATDSAVKAANLRDKYDDARCWDPDRPEAQKK